MLQSNKMDTVVFDLGNVLVDYNWKYCLEKLGYFGELQQKLAEAVFLSDAWLEGDRGNATPESWLSLFLLNAPEYENEIRRIYEHLDLTIRNLPYTKQIIRTFQNAGFRVYFLSNYSEYLYQKSKSKLNFLKNFDGGIFSYQEKCIKPQEEIYNRLLTRYNIHSDASWFFDDRPENVKAACQAGMHGIVFSETIRKEILAGKYTGGIEK